MKHEGAGKALEPLLAEELEAVGELVVVGVPLRGDNFIQVQRKHVAVGVQLRVQAVV